MIPDFAGRLFEVVKLDWGLHLWTDNNWEFILSERVLVTTTDAEGLQQSEVEVDVEPGPVPEPLVGLEGARITQVLVSRAGDLGIQLTDRHLTVRASPRYEAWQVNGSGGEMFICSPGGALTHFPPLRRDQPDS